MKVKPEILLIKETEPLYKETLIAGNDEVYIKHVADQLVERFKNKNYFIDRSGKYDPNLNGDLFTDNKTLFVLSEKPPKEELGEDFVNNHQAYIISSPNNTKINKIKKEYSNSKNSLLVECYSLDLRGKETVINNFLQTNNIKLSKDVYWYVLDNFENRYVLLLRQLQTLSLLGKSVKNINDVELAVFVEKKVEINKIFFELLQKNENIIKTFNNNIFSYGDFYILLNHIKLYLRIISSSENLQISLSRFPKYLFNEKEKFIKIYKLLNKDKVLKIYESIFRVEKLIRDKSEFFNTIGLRFVLNLKKIITS